MRIGIYGGTFDPVHVGHLILAEQAREQSKLDEVWFLLSFRPPQKEDQNITRYEQRVEMLSLAIAGHPAFRVEEIEKERPGLSYTIDTLKELKRRHREHTFLLLIGGDSLADLPGWRDPRGIIEEAGLVVMERPGVPRTTADELRQKLGLPADSPLSLEFVDAPLIEVSSRELRKRVGQGRSIRYYVPRAVEVYVQEKGLYRE
jgi:nicotinate-nucleotide adenylyltransferase